VSKQLTMDKIRHNRYALFFHQGAEALELRTAAKVVVSHQDLAVHFFFCQLAVAPAIRLFRAVGGEEVTTVRRNSTMIAQHGPMTHQNDRSMDDDN
jgi:hypothetical protein